MTNTTPYNAITNQPYKGMNAAKLSAHELWAGFHQWQSKGLAVKKGERGTMITVILTVLDKKTGQPKQVPTAAYVFHAGQVEPLKDFKQPPAGKATHAHHTHQTGNTHAEQHAEKEV